jgi:hypothetical protein
VDITTAQRKNKNLMMCELVVVVFWSGKNSHQSPMFFALIARLAIPTG